MKSLFLIISIVLISIKFNAQNKLCYDVYYYKNPEHEIKQYKNILVKTNANQRSYRSLRKAARKAKYKITFFDALFPPIKNYTDAEIAKAIKENHIDAILYYTIKGTSVTESNYTYGSYSIPKNGVGSMTSYKPTHKYTTIEAALVEPFSKDIREFYCEGGASGNSFDVTYRVFNKILKRFKKIGIAMPLEKDDSNTLAVSAETLKSEEYLKYEEEGNSNFESKNYAQALEDFNKVVELKPDYYLGYFTRARVKSALGDSKGSIEDNNKVIELKSDFSMAYNNRGWDNYLLKNYIEALKDFNKAIELDPRNDVAYDSRQETKFALNDFAGCMEDCNMAISLNPKLANSYFFRGKIYFKNGDKTKACENWSKAGQYGIMEAYELIKQNCN